MNVRKLLQRIHTKKNKELEEYRKYKRITGGNQASSRTSLKTVDETNCYLHASAPNLLEIKLQEYMSEKHDHGYINEKPEFTVPKRRSSLRKKRPNSLKLLSSVSENNLAEDFEDSNPPVPESQIYEPDHQYYIPPAEMGRKSAVPQDTLNKEPKRVIVEKTEHEIWRASWFNKFIFGASDLLILRTVRIKVPVEHKGFYKGLSFKTLCKINTSKVDEKVMLYRKNSYKEYHY